MINQKRKSEAGGIFTYIYLTIFGGAALIIYCAVQIYPFYSYNKEVQLSVTNMIRYVDDINETKKEIWELFLEYDMPISKSDIKFQRDGNELTLQIEYVEVLVLLGYDVKEFPFEIYATGQLTS